MPQKRNVNERYGLGRTELHLAYQDDDGGPVRSLLDAGAKIELSVGIGLKRQLPAPRPPAGEHRDRPRWGACPTRTRRRRRNTGRNGGVLAESQRAAHSMMAARSAA
jgi:hypothetical protein